jgi:hypothetical protein
MKTEEAFDADARTAMQRVRALLQSSEAALGQMLGAVTTNQANLAQAVRDLNAARLELDGLSAADKRRADRFAELAVVMVATADGETVQTALWNISLAGACIESDRAFRTGERCRIRIPGLPDPVACTVVGAQPPIVRLMFDPLTPDETLLLVKHLDHYMQAGAKLP